MKTRHYILIGAALTLAAGITLYFASRKKNERTQRRIAISDAGYETAADLLYPLRSQRFPKTSRN